MKLALCFSGDTRTYLDCFDSIKKNLFDRYDCDVFISTYETDEETKANLFNLYNPKKCNIHNKESITNLVTSYIEQLNTVKWLHCDVSDLCFDNIKYMYGIENYFFNYNNYESNFIYRNLSVESVCQFFGIHDVSKLCKEYMMSYNVNYDYILRIRLDNIIYGNFLIHHLEENEVLVNTFHYYSDSIKINDHFFMAKPETFFKISSLFENIPNVIEIINQKKCWLPHSGYQETLLTTHIVSNNILIKESSNFCCIKLGYSFEDSKWDRLLRKKEKPHTILYIPVEIINRYSK